MKRSDVINDMLRILNNKYHIVLPSEDFREVTEELFKYIESIGMIPPSYTPYHEYICDCFWDEEAT